MKGKTNMGIHFDRERWKQIEKDYTLWWEGKLERPLIKAVVKSAYPPERKKPDVPVLSMKNCNCLEYSPEEIVDALDYELCQYEFLGDAFPLINMAAFGPGALAGFCGAGLDNSTGTVWYFPVKQVPVEELHVKYVPDNVCAKRIKDIYRAGKERWGSQVLMSMPDLGSVQDVLATLLGNEEYMFALFDEPEEVLRVQNEIWNAFMDAYRDLESVLGTDHPGYSDWSGLYSKERSYIFQDDFAYMISPEMFEEYALDDIKKLKKEFPNAMYHLDGVGNLKHLDMLLDNTDIQAYQWVYGAGQPSARHWMEVYDRLHERGKNMEIIGSVEDFSCIAEKNAKGLFYHLLIDDEEGTAKRNEAYKDCLSDYHIVEWSRRKETEELIRRWKG